MYWLGFVSGVFGTLATLFVVSYIYSIKYMRRQAQERA